MTRPHRRSPNVSTAPSSRPTGALMVVSRACDWLS